MIGLGRKAGDLYILDNTASSEHLHSHNSFSVNSSLYDSTFVKNNLWHYRLGHPSNTKLHSIKEYDSSISVSSTTNPHPCNICPFAKQKRLPFLPSAHKSSSIFDLIHCDIWGPFHVQTLNKHSYFLSIVDDYSRATWIYLMKNKSEVIDLIPTVYNLILNQFNVSIKVLRSDNGPEFNLFDFYKDKGIIHQLSCVDTPQ